MVTRIARVEAVACDSEHEAAWLERNLLERELPYWNRTRGGQEVPVYICLDPQASSPGLRVVHTPALSPGSRQFGPYLGGNKVRLAVSALLRAMPLTYAGEDQTGFGRDMARMRSVGPADRGALIDAVTAVLDRDTAALKSLRGELWRRRDRAALDLAFEVAARLQAEVDAIDWVVSAQKAALPEPLDFDVSGWAGGVLVRFDVRGGRLCVWRQRACLEAAARAQVSATPAAWAEFAHRNAELAARLAQCQPALRRRTSPSDGRDLQAQIRDRQAEDHENHRKRWLTAAQVIDGGAERDEGQAERRQRSEPGQDTGGGWADKPDRTE